MDEFVKELLLQAPNLAVALAVLYWQRRTIDQLLANQTALIDRLLEAIDTGARRDEAPVNPAERSVG